MALFKAHRIPIKWDMEANRKRGNYLG